MAHKIMVALLSLSFLFLGCAKKQQSAKSKVQLVNYSSPIPYTFDKSVAETAAAMVDGQEVAWDQLLTQDVALQELQERYFQQAIAFAYAWVTRTDSTSGQTLNIFVSEPKKDLKEILAGAGVEFVEGVKVTYELKPGSSDLASSEGQSVTWHEFKAANMAHSRQYEKLFRQRMQRLDGITVRRFLLKAAKAEDLAMEAYVQKHIMTAKSEPTDEEAKEFGRSKNISDKQLDEKMVGRLKDILRQNSRDKKIQDYVAKNLVKEPVKIGFEPPVIEIKAGDMIDSLPKWGKSQGPDLLFVGHWDCQGCDAALSSFLNLREGFKERLNGFFLYSFSERDREARMGAEAAFCVKDQDDMGFWTFMQKIMEIKEDSVEERINIAAQGSGIDYDQFRDCFLKRTHQQKVDTHLKFAKEMGVTRAPMVILNGQVIDAPVDAKTIGSKLESMGFVQKAKKMGIIDRIKAFFGF